MNSRVPQGETRVGGPVGVSSPPATPAGPLIAADEHLVDGPDLTWIWNIADEAITRIRKACRGGFDLHLSVEDVFCLANVLVDAGLGGNEQDLTP